MTSQYHFLPHSPLSRTEAHLWYAFPEAITDPSLLGAYYDLMCAEERDRYQRLRFAQHRHEFLITRALVRTTLSRYAGVEPATWQFTHNEYGKPAIAHPENILPLSFNLSNTTGLVACLVTLGYEAGVDVEDTMRPGETVDIAEHYFSSSEVMALRTLPTEQQRCRFFTYWTLKEAYIKARGMGISLPLEQFSFHLEPDKSIRISFDPRLPDDPQAWQFALFHPTERHLLAVAIRRGAAPDLTIMLKRTIPLLL